MDVTWLNRWTLHRMRSGRVGWTSHQVVVTKLSSASRLINSAEAPETLESDLGKSIKFVQMKAPRSSSRRGTWWGPHRQSGRASRDDPQAMVGAVLKGGDGVKR